MSAATVPDKVLNTPEFDVFMSTYMAKQGRDPRKILEKGLKAVQDKLLYIFGPLTQNSGPGGGYSNGTIGPHPS